MAGQIHELRVKTYPRVPIVPDDTKPASHSCQCNHANPPGQDLAKLAAKLLKVMQACANVPKDGQNKVQGYKYASSDVILGKVNPALCGAGLATVCKLEILDRQPRTTSTGEIWELCTIRCILTIIDSDTGASIESEGIGQGYDGSDKSISKAQTQAKKYAWLMALNMSTGEDPEGDERSDWLQVPAVPCSKCKCPAAYIKDEDFEGKPVKVYFCKKCKKETRKVV